jgi:hypothetical protein
MGYAPFSSWDIRPASVFWFVLSKEGRALRWHFGNRFAGAAAMVTALIAE